MLNKSSNFNQLANEVKSGDKTNIESIAARKYWSLLFGRDFVRDRNQDGINSMLNYSYTIFKISFIKISCSLWSPPLASAYIIKINIIIYV